MPKAKTESALSLSTMYVSLSYAPDAVLICKTSGYTVVITHPRTEHDDTLVEIYDVNLMRGVWFTDTESHDMISVDITSLADSSRPDEVLITAHLRGRRSWNLRTTLDAFAPSSIPSRVFTIRVPHAVDAHIITSVTLYKIPTNLCDFIKLLRVQEHVRKMVVCVRTLSHYHVVSDVVAVIVILATQLYHVFEYAQYCEYQTSPPANDTKSDD